MKYTANDPYAHLKAIDNVKLMLKLSSRDSLAF